VVADRIGISPGRYRYALLVAREIRYGHTRFQDIAMSTRAPATCSPHGCANSNKQA
jgi:hypothetical protein